MPLLKHSFSPLRSRRQHRTMLRDLYVSGLLSVFRRHSVLRVWEPQRETPPRRSDERAD